MTLRTAIPSDAPAIGRLIEASVRGLGSQRYNPKQVEKSLQYLFGVDTQMINDGSYFVVEDGQELVGAGGWSKRRTPFGGDQAGAVRDAGMRDPLHEPAIIRAFYVHPDWARRGIGRIILDASERAAWEAGFRQYALVATLPGLPFYLANDYVAGEAIEIHLPEGTLIEAVQMVKIPDAME